MRNRTGQIYNDVEITNVAAEGKAMAKIDNIVVFVKGVVPGDVVDIQITHRSRNFREAKPIAFKNIPNNVPNHRASILVSVADVFGKIFLTNCSSSTNSSRWRMLLST